MPPLTRPKPQNPALQYETLLSTLSSLELQRESLLSSFPVPNNALGGPLVAKQTFSADHIGTATSTICKLQLPFSLQSSSSSNLNPTSDVLDKDETPYPTAGHSVNDSKLEYANHIVKEHIALLQHYNAIKDAGQIIMGFLAERERLRDADSQGDVTVPCEEEHTLGRGSGRICDVMARFGVGNLE